MSRDYSIRIQRLDGGGVESAVSDGRGAEIRRFPAQETWEAAEKMVRDWIKRQRRNDKRLDVVISGRSTDLISLRETQERRNALTVRG